MRKVLMFVLTLCLGLAAVSAFGQGSDSGQLAGKVSDPQGALVSGASVLVKSVDTGAEVNATSDSDGSYTVAKLKPGLYDVTVTAKGYAASTQRVQVTVGSVTNVSTAMSIQAVTAGVNITIAESGIAVNTSNQEVSNVVSSTQLRELPSLTRNAYDFVAGSGGVASDVNGSTGRGVGVAINGQRAASTNILLDGGENVNTFTAAVGQTVPLDAVAEYRVITNNFSAQYGRATGGIVDVATKSGTNSIHGTGYEFNRVSRLASNGFDNNANGLPRPHFTRNQFGYSIGGPIKKNNLFFFSSTEWTRVRSATDVITIEPTAQLLALSAPSIRTFFSAFTLAHPINGTIFTVGSVVAANSIGAGAFANLPASTPAFGESRFAVPADVGAGSPQDTYQTVARIDWNMSSRTQLFGRFAYDHKTFSQGTINFSPYDGYDTGERDKNQNWNVTITHSFSPRFTSATKFIFNRLFQLQPLGKQPVSPTLYLTNSTGTRLNNRLVSFPGYSQFSPGNAIPFGGPQNVGEINSDLGYTHDKHQLTFGGSIIYLQDNRAFGAYQNATEQLSSGSSKTSGLNNFVLGNLGIFQAAVNPQGKFPGDTLTLPVSPPDFTRSNRYRDWDAYFNDSWRVQPRLTLNLGIRYEYYGVQHNKNPNLDSNFVFGTGANFYERFRNGSVQKATTSPIGGLWAPDKNNFAPRLGFAWDVKGDGKTSIRGGYGLAYERNFGNVTFNVIQNPPAYAVVSITPADVGTINVTLNNAGPLAGSGGTKVLPAVSLRLVRQDIATAYSHIFGVTFEHELFPGTVFSAAFNGSRGNKLYSLENINRVGFGTAYLGSRATRPPAIGGTVDRLNGQYGNVNTRGNGGTSRYEAFVASLESSNFRKHRGINLEGLQFTARYTYSVARDNLSSTFSESNANFNLGLLDPFDPKLDYGYADFDVRHRFSGSMIWDLPFFKNSKGVAKHLLGGWSLSGFFIARTGLPFTLYDCSFARTVCMRAELNGAISKSGAPVPGSPNLFTYLNTSALQTGLYSTINGDQEVGPYPADMSRRNAFRGPGFWNIDGGLYKNIKLRENVRLQLRGEFYNIFNHANLFVIPDSLDVEGGGNVTSCKACLGLASDRRNLQFAAKIIF